MDKCKWTVVAALSALALLGCSRQESAADAQRRADAAAIKGSEKVMDAKRDAANATINANEDVAKAEDKAARQVDNAEANAVRTTTNAEVKVALAQAERDYDVAVAKCRALNSDDYKNCKSQAQANLDAAKAAANVARQDAKAESGELKR